MELIGIKKVKLTLNTHAEDGFEDSCSENIIFAEKYPWQSLLLRKL